MSCDSDDPMSYGSDDSFLSFEYMMEQMDKLFPNLPFSPIIEHYDCLEDSVLEEPYALIYQNRTCYCVDGGDPTPITIIINSYNGKNITYRNFYEEIEKKWDKKYLPCNHNFLEGLSVYNNIIQLEFGS